MQLRQIVPRFVIGLLVGFYCVVVLHGCQTASPPQPPVAAEPATTTIESPKAASPTPLPPETAAIVVSAGPNGVFNPPRGDVRFVVISDLNDVYGSTDYSPEVDKGIALIPFWKPDMVLCSGDMVAGQDPTLTDDRLRAMWAAFDDHVAAPLRRAKLPYGFTVGNHDASSALGVQGTFLFQRERNVAAEYWKQPSHNPGVTFIDKFEFPFYYTFEYQGVFFLAWDGSSNIISKEKLAWVEKALASEKAQSAKLRILLGHLPLYAVAVGRNEPAEVMDNADQLRAMLEKYNVHTYISGHHHSYYPGHRGKLQLLHMGILGSGPRPLIDSRTRPWKALTVLDVNFNSPELTTYTTYDINTLKVIEFNQLPRFLTGHNGIVLRRDVEASELTAEEKASCADRLGEKLCRA